MKIISLKISSKINVGIKIGWFKEVFIEIATKDFLKIKNDPSEWGNIDAIQWNKDTMKSAADELSDMYDKNPEETCSILLAIAGKNPDSTINARTWAILNYK